MNHQVSSLIEQPKRVWGWGPDWVLICACGFRFIGPDPLELNRNHEMHTIEAAK